MSTLEVGLFVFSMYCTTLAIARKDALRSAKHACFEIITAPAVIQQFSWRVGDREKYFSKLTEVANLPRWVWEGKSSEGYQQILFNYLDRKWPKWWHLQKSLSGIYDDLVRVSTESGQVQSELALEIASEPSSEMSKK